MHARICYTAQLARRHLSYIYVRLYITRHNRRQYWWSEQLLWCFCLLVAFFSSRSRIYALSMSLQSAQSVTKDKRRELKCWLSGWDCDRWCTFTDQRRRRVEKSRQQRVASMLLYLTKAIAPHHSAVFNVNLLQKWLSWFWLLITFAKIGIEKRPT